MRCDGRPEGACPDSRNDSTVRPSQGELMLCVECEKYRFPYLYPKSTGGTTGQNQQSAQHVTMDKDKPAATMNELTDGSIAPKRQIMLNDVLCFINNKFRNHPVAVIKSTMLDFYREDEILSAKHVLLQCVSDKSLFAALQSFVKKRIGDNKIKSTVDDIMHMWSTIDERKALATLPVFCSSDMCRIAVIPDELNDLAYVRTVIDDLKKQVKDLTAVVSQLSSEQKQSCCCRVTSHQKNGKNYVSANGCHIQPATAALSCEEGGGTSSHDQMATVTAVESESNGSSSGSSDVHTGNVEQLSSSGNYADIARHHPDDNKESWQPVQKKKPWKKNGVVGKSAENISFKGVLKKSVICVSRLELGTSEQKVLDFLKSQGIEVESCYKVSPAGTESKFVMMRVCVPHYEIPKMYNSEMWPESVIVRPWRFKTRPQN